MEYTQSCYRLYLDLSHQSVIPIQKLHFHFMAPSSACAVLRPQVSHADLTIFGTVHVRGHRTVQTLMTALYHVTNVKAGAVIGLGITSAAPRIDLPTTQPAESFFFFFSVSRQVHSLHPSLLLQMRDSRENSTNLSITYSTEAPTVKLP